MLRLRKTNDFKWFSVKVKKKSHTVLSTLSSSELHTYINVLWACASSRTDHCWPSCNACICADKLPLFNSFHFGWKLRDLLEMDDPIAVSIIPHALLSFCQGQVHVVMLQSCWSWPFHSGLELNWQTELWERNLKRAQELSEYRLYSIISDFFFYTREPFSLLKEEIMASY